MHLFAPVSYELLERASELVHVKISRFIFLAWTMYMSMFMRRMRMRMGMRMGVRTGSRCMGCYFIVRA